jgi:hypothetical protein
MPANTLRPTMPVAWEGLHGLSPEGFVLGSCSYNALCPAILGNIGGDGYNLDLSSRRAATVKQALVTQYHIAPDRLTPAGFGATRLVDSNDTLEGPARNRRVELVRE